MKQKLAMLICLTLAANMAACGDSTDTPVTGADTTAPGSETTVGYAPQLPDMDMNGETFTILTQGWWEYSPLAITDILVEEQTGEPLNDAAYNRQQEVMAKYNFQLTVMDYPDHTEGISQLINAISAGENVFDMAIIRGTNYTTLALQKMLTDLNEIPNLDLYAPYYDAASCAALSVADRLFGIVSDITTLRYKTASCSFVNLRLIEDYGCGDIYETVNNGDWTFDKMLEFGKLHASDVGMDGSYTNSDHYALTYIVDSIDAMLEGSGIRFAEFDSDGQLTLTIDRAGNIDKMQAMLELLKDTTISYNVHRRSPSDEVNADEVGMFIDGKSMFSIGGIYYGPQFRDMEDDFAILPVPKLDASQEGYFTPFSGHFVPITVVPVTNDRLEATGVLMEELSYYGHRDLYPELYETLLKNKVARDENSFAMIDMMFENTLYDAGAFYFPNEMTTIRNLFLYFNDTFASTIDSLKPSIEARIEDMMEVIEN